MKMTLKIAALCVLSAPLLRAATTGPVSVVFSPRGSQIIANPAAIGYGPDWAVATNATSVTADLLVVSHIGENCVSTQTFISAASTSGAVALTPATAGANACRLILRTKSGATTLGELVRDVSFGVASAQSDFARIDMADDKLGRALRAGEKPRLAYADWWTNDVATLRIDLEGCRKDGVPVQSELFGAAAPAEGEFTWTSPVVVKGNYGLKLRFYDSSNELLDTLTASYSGFVGLGMIISFK